MAGRYIAKSLSGATKIAPKLRPIVKNPDERYKTDARRAPLGVYRYDKNGARVFRPIYRTGEYGKIRFFDRRSFSWFQHAPGDNHWERLPSGPDVANPQAVAPGIMTDKRRVIGRRGLAKKVWTWAATNMTRGGSASFFQVPDVARIAVSGGTHDPTIKINDNLRYATAAMRPGAVDSVLGNAARNMAYNIDKAAQKVAGGK
jgi:hypothetical protein